MTTKGNKRGSLLTGGGEKGYEIAGRPSLSFRKKKTIKAPSQKRKKARKKTAILQKVKKKKQCRLSENISRLKGPGGKTEKPQRERSDIEELIQTGKGAYEGEGWNKKGHEKNEHRAG